MFLQLNDCNQQPKITFMIEYNYIRIIMTSNYNFVVIIRLILSYSFEKHDDDYTITCNLINIYEISIITENQFLSALDLMYVIHE